MNWTWHTKISFLKSFLRIVGFFALGLQYFLVAAILLITAEAFGVLEEF